MSNNNYETIINYEEYFDISDSGEVSLKEEYRGDYDGKNPDFQGNGLKLELPEVLVIPKVIREITVTALAPGMFSNNKRVKWIVLPEGIETIPDFFCRYATDFRGIYNTKNIREIGASAFVQTRIKSAIFPRLGAPDALGTSGTLGYGAFARCAYLEVADIGTITSIPEKAFMDCTLLRKVIRKIEEGETVAFTISKEAFAHTHTLRKLPLLEYATSVESDAFFYSGISEESLPEGNEIETDAFPITENEESWAALKPTQCRNRIVTKLSQLNPAWKDERFLQGEPTEVNSHPYRNACAIFATMHIYSALAGKHYHHPGEFVEELKTIGLSQYVHTDGWPGDITKVPKLFEDLGYRTEICGKYSDLTIEDYQKLADALADGAYIYSQVSTSNTRDYGHAAVIYGITDKGEVCVLDSNVLYEDYRDYGFEPNTDIYTYTIPFTNIVGPESNFIIVYPPEKKTVVERTICAVDNAFTSASLPSEYPVDWVTTCCVTNDAGLPSPHNGILTAYRGKDYAYRTFVPHDQTVLHMQMKSLDEEDGDKWLEWSTFGSAGTTNDSSGETPSAE